MLDDALTAFSINKSEMNDPNQFNMKILNKKYHTRAKEVHPDRNNGDHSGFIKLTEQYSILTAQYELIHGNSTENINQQENGSQKSISMNSSNKMK